MKSLKLLNSLVGFAMFLSIFSAEANAQTAGSLDTSFGANGVVATNLRQTAALYDIAVQPDRKVLVGGATFENMIVVMVGTVARFNENGTLDTTFDTDGFNNSGFIKTVYALKLLPNGKILVGGNSIDNLFSIARLNSDGSLDTTFDGDGVVTTTVGSRGGIRAFEVLPDGKILAVGWTTLISSTNNADMAMVKYNADGSLDTSFGSNGRVATELGGNEWMYDLAVQADGKFVVAGEHFDSLSGQTMATVIRYNTNGSMDTQFANSGKIFNTSSPYTTATKVTLQADGKIIIVGAGIPPTRYNADGTFDTTFNTVQWSGTSTLSTQSDGKIIVGGTTQNTTLLARYNTNGTPDTSFGTGGTAPVTIPINDSALTPDAKIVVGGNISQLKMSRYFVDSPSGGFADFDGDGRTDISIFRPSVGEWWVNRSYSGQTVAAQFGASSDKPAPADFTGDGKTDITFFRPSTGEWFILRSEDNSFLSFPFGTGGDIPIPADFDADGKADPAVFRPSTNEWFVSKSTGGTMILTFGTAGDVPVAADYDGDGKTDVAVFRPSDGSWWYLRSSDGQFSVYRFGLGTDKPVQGDYTGDGKTDLAVFRPSTGEWFVQRSEDNSYYSVTFGAAGDIPIPGDYDGDGKFDTAVFRPSTSTWYVNRSTTGIFITTFGAAGDRPVPNVFVP